MSAMIGQFSYPITLPAVMQANVLIEIPWPNLNLGLEACLVELNGAEHVQLHLRAVRHSTEHPCPLLDLLSNTWRDDEHYQKKDVYEKLDAWLKVAAPDTFTADDLRQICIADWADGSQAQIEGAIWTAVKLYRAVQQHLPESEQMKQIEDCKKHDQSFSEPFRLARMLFGFDPDPRVVCHFADALARTRDM